MSLRTADANASALSPMPRTFSAKCPCARTHFTPVEAGPLSRRNSSAFSARRAGSTAGSPCRALSAKVRSAAGVITSPSLRRVVRTLTYSCPKAAKRLHRSLAKALAQGLPSSSTSANRAEQTSSKSFRKGLPSRARWLAPNPVRRNASSAAAGIVTSALLRRRCRAPSTSLR